MFKYGVTCALEALPASAPVTLRADGDIRTLAKTARELGYDALELCIRNPAQYDAVALKKAADDNGLGYCGLLTGLEYSKNGLLLISDDDAVRQAAVERLYQHIDLAQTLDTAVVVGIMRGNIPDFRRYQEYEDRLTQALMQLSAYAAPRRVPLYVESINRYLCNYLCTVSETADYLNRLNLANVFLHIDTHSMAVEDSDFAAAVRYSGKRLGYVHFTDNNRRYPGGGNVDFLSVMQALSAIGYEGYIAIECQPYPDDVTCADRAIAYCRALETCMRIKAYH